MKGLLVFLALASVAVVAGHAILTWTATSRRHRRHPRERSMRWLWVSFAALGIMAAVGAAGYVALTIVRSPDRPDGVLALPSDSGMPLLTPSPPSPSPQAPTTKVRGAGSGIGSCRTWCPTPRCSIRSCHTHPHRPVTRAPPPVHPHPRPHRQSKPLGQPITQSFTEPDRQPFADRLTQPDGQSLADRLTQPDRQSLAGGVIRPLRPVNSARRTSWW